MSDAEAKIKPKPDFDACARLQASWCVAQKVVSEQSFADVFDGAFKLAAGQLLKTGPFCSPINSPRHTKRQTRAPKTRGC